MALSHLPCNYIYTVYYCVLCVGLQLCGQKLLLIRDHDLFAMTTYNKVKWLNMVHEHKWVVIKFQREILNKSFWNQHLNPFIVNCLKELIGMINYLLWDAAFSGNAIYFVFFNMILHRKDSVYYQNIVDWLAEMYNSTP